MKNFIFTLFVISIFSMGASAQQPTALHLTLSRAFRLPNSKAVTQMLKDNLPDHKIVEVEVNPRLLAVGNNDGAQKVLARLKGSLAPGDVVTHLVIDTPEKSLYTASAASKKDFFDRVSVQWDSLQYFGSLFGGAVASQLKQTVALLRGQISPHLILVFNGNKVLAGSNEEAASKAQALLNEIGATNGTLYASNTPERETVYATINRGFADQTQSSERKVFNRKDLSALGKAYAVMAPRLRQLRTLLPVSVALGIPLALHYTVAGHTDAESIKNFGQALLGSTVLTFSAGTFMVITFNAWVSDMAHMLGFINVGRRFTFENGRIVGVQSMRRDEDLNKIYGFEKCADTLANVESL